jgi:TonB family protein
MNTAVIQRDWAGSVIDGRFRLLDWLGGSEGGGVFLTELEDQSRKAAIKLIPADDVDGEARIAGWAAAAGLSHPHLMRVYHTGRCQIGNTGLLFVVTEHAEEVLSEILPVRPLTPGEAREMLDPILDALFYLHGKGFVHGHLKPSNIMVVDNELKLSSDGLRVTGERAARLQPLAVYDAPECAGGKISPAADVWSFGVTLVEALAQQPPVWDRLGDSEPVVPRSVPQPFSDIAEECLRLDPARRCTLSYVKLLLDPARFLPGPGRKTVKEVPPKRRMIFVTAAVLVLVALVAAMLVRSHKAAQRNLPQPSAAQSTPAAQPQAAPAITPAPPPSPAPAPAQSAVPVPAQPPVPAPAAARGGVVQGTVVERVMPNVAERASQTIEGKVVVAIRVAVDPSGNISNATFESQGPSKYFANLALQAARSWKFTPAQVGGQAVPSVWIVRFEFRRTGTEATPVEKTP